MPARNSARNSARNAARKAAPSSRRTRAAVVAEYSMTVDGIDVLVVRKAIKNWRLTVSPPDARVRLAAPLHVSDDMLRTMVIERIAWIRGHQARMAAQPRLPAREYLSGETHLYLGHRYRLVVEECNAPPQVSAGDDGTLHLRVRPGSDRTARERVLYAWYRERLLELAPALLDHWQGVLGVQAGTWQVKRMRTRWGTCNPAERRIWLNLHLIKRPLACIEYVVVHELAHLLERGHNARFWAILDLHLPDWRPRRTLLNEYSLDEV
ncbi:MAG: M48 family metallopeptidase [Caldilineaceae bacterium]